MGIEQDVTVGESSLPWGLFGSGWVFEGRDAEEIADTAPVDGAWWSAQERAAELAEEAEYVGSRGPAGRAQDLGEVLDPVGWLRVCARARAQDAARELAAVHAIARRYRQRGAEDFAADEVGHALGWSASMAAARLQLAADVFDRLPALGWALGVGASDEVKVATVAEETRTMPDDLAREVCARVLPQAARIPKSTLIDLIGSTAVALDPDWAARREQAARARVRVRVEYSRNPTGTGSIAVRDLAAEDQVRSKARCDAIAAAIKAGGLARGVRARIAAVRGLVHLRLLDGSCSGLDDDQLIAALTDQLSAWLAAIDPHASESDDGLADIDPPGHGPEGSGPDDGGPDGGGPDGGGPDGGGPDGGGPDGGGPDGGGPEGGGPDGGGPDGGGPDDDPSERRGGVRAGVSELRLRLSTALGLDDLPADIPSYGAVTAPTARRMLDRARTDDVPVEWRLVLVDDHGHLEYVLLLRPGPPPGRPAGPRRRDRRGRPTPTTRGRMIVELAAPTTMVAALDPHRHAAWATFIRRAHQRLAGLADQDRPGGTAHPATSLADARHRRPGRELDRWIRVRDRHCIGLLCSHPAHRADLDHTRAWIDHGPTVAGNLGGPCRRCHRRKHDAGWGLDQPDPGRFRWHTLLGATYSVEPRPVITDRPAPSPRADGQPRPVLDVDPPPDDHDTGWTHDRGCRMTVPAEVPTPRRPAAPAWPDEPTF